MILQNSSIPVKNIIGFFVRLLSVKTLISEKEIPIFMYHRVLDKIDLCSLDENIYITANSLKNNILFLQKYYTIISLHDLIAKKNKLGRACVISFDDGWLDNYEFAFPILKKYQIPATIFLPTGMIGTNKWFWFERVSRAVNYAEKHYKNLSIVQKRIDTVSGFKNANIIFTKKELYDYIVKILKKKSPKKIEEFLTDIEVKLQLNKNNTRMLINWDEVREMSNYGISFGSHCVNHSILTNLSYEDKSFEISASRKTLIEKNINYVDCISFPNGNYDQETLDLAENVGYKMLLTASINRCGMGESSLLAHRIGITKRLSMNNNLLSYYIVKAKTKNKLFILS